MKKTLRKGRASDEASGAKIDTHGNVLKMVELEKKQRDERTLGERIAEWIALFCGSMIFVYVHVVWFGGWVILNEILKDRAFDPFPYTFLTLVVSLEAIFLSTFILISQNHDTRLSERRNQFDLQINMLTEQENTKMLDILGRIAKKVGVPCDDDDLAELLKPMEPEDVVGEILKAQGEGVKQK